MFPASTSPVTPWNIPGALSATSHLAMTQLPPLSGPRMNAYLDAIQRENCGIGTDNCGAGTVRSATIFSPYELLFGFSEPLARVGIQTLHDDWELGLDAFRNDNKDFFAIRPGQTKERVLVANIGAALLAAGHIPQMLLAWTHVKDKAREALYGTAEKEVMAAQADRLLGGGARTRFDLLAMETEQTVAANPKLSEGLWNLCRMIIVPSQGPHSQNYTFRLPAHSADNGWKGQADQCANLLAIGAARLIELEHNYTDLCTNSIADETTFRIGIIPRQFGDAWLIGVKIFFKQGHSPSGSEWEPPVIRIGDRMLPLTLHQFERTPDGGHAGIFATAYRLNLRPGVHKLDLTVSWNGKDMRKEYNYTVPDWR